MDAIKHPIMHRTTPHNKELSSQNVISVEVEKPCEKLKLECNVKHIGGGAMEQRGWGKIIQLRERNLAWVGDDNMT